MKRVLTAIVFLPILFYLIWIQGPLPFVFLAAIAILLGVYEFSTLAGTYTDWPSRVLSLLAAASICVASYCGHLQWLGGIIALLVIGELILKLWREPDLQRVLPTSAIPVFGVLYVAGLGAFIISLRMIESDIPMLAAKLLTLFFVIVFAGDTFAYYTGRTIGRHKLAPHISPGKTVEGAIGGLFGNALAAVIAHYTFFPELPLAHAIPLGVVMGTFGILGDLAESMLKRGAHIKDAGKMIPGHGGLLDRLDSMVFNAPILYYYSQSFLR